MEQEISHRFTKEFQYDGLSYLIDVVPYLYANEMEKKEYFLGEGQFLVHLFNGDSSYSFSVFYNDRLEWDSNVSKLVLDDKNLIERIGFLIDDYFA
jgi:hypothetical protein